MIERFNIDHFHKWRPLLHSFVFMLIRPTALVLKQIFFWNLLVVARLVGLIGIKTKEYFIWPPLWSLWCISMNARWHSDGASSLVILWSIEYQGNEPSLKYSVHRLIWYNLSWFCSRRFEGVGDGIDNDDNDLIGWVRKNNRSARATRTLVDFFDVLCRMTT